MASKTHAISITGDILYSWAGCRQGGHVVLESHICFNYARMDSKCSGISRVSILTEYTCTRLASANLLRLHILGIYEVAHTRRMAWLFEVDYLDYIWNFLHKFTRIHRPHYTTDEDNSGHIPTSGHLPMTGYHLLVTSTVFIVGMTKSALLYVNHQTEATTLECVFGVFVATGCVDDYDVC
jgi:hypothetical protein